MWNSDSKGHEAKYRPIYSPRTAYLQIRKSDQDLLADMTLNFDKFTINLLKREFEVQGGEMTLIQFISIVHQHLKAWQTELPNREVRLVRCLSILFKEIDINGNGLLDWEEFTNYIIEKATVLKNLKTKSDEVKSYTRVALKHKVKVESPISKCIFIEGLNRVAMFQEGTNVVNFLNPQNGQQNPKPLSLTMKQLVVNISSVKKEKDGRLQIKKKDLIITTDNRLLDILYIADDKYKTLVTSTSDGMVRGWKFHNGGWVMATQPDNEEEFFEHHFSEEVYCLSWDSLNEIMYCGQNSGAVSMWNLKSDTERMLESQGEEKHELLITDIITMPKLQFVATSSMDSKLILWNTINYKVKCVYREHNRGILSLAFNESLILLFSAGFDHQICIWNPYISTLIHKIQTHSFPIICLKITESNNQLLSVDSEGFVKIYDTRRFSNISGFSMSSQNDSNSFNPSSMCVTTNPLRVIIAGSSINVFEYDKFYNPAAVDDSPAICCKYIPQSLIFLTPSGNKVKVWNALNGDINKIYLNICTSDITAFCLDHLKRRMIIGTLKGDCAIYNTTNGAKLRELSRHSGEVVQILSHKADDIEVFITAGIDGKVLIYKEMDDLDELPRVINVKKDITISKMVYSPKTNHLMIGMNNGHVGFFDIDSTKLMGSFVAEDEVVGLHLTDKVLIVVSVRGKVVFTLLPPSPQKFEEAFSFCHQEEEGVDRKRLDIVTSEYSQLRRTLFVVDEKSNISAYKYHLDESTLNTSTRVEPVVFSQVNELVSLLWVTKIHTQLIRSIDFDPTEDILMTTAFDKRVHIWSAKDGSFIDSLQQNYEKLESFPIAYERISDKEILSTNMELLFKRRPSLRTSTRYRVSLTEDSPFDQYNAICNQVQNKRSNPDWKLFLKTRQHYESQKQHYENILQEVKETDYKGSTFIEIKELANNNDNPLVLRKKELDQLIHEKKEEISKKINQKNLTARNVLRDSIQKISLTGIKPLEERLQITLNRQEKRIFNSVKKQSARYLSNPVLERENQLQQVERLAKSRYQAVFLDNSTLKTVEERKAANKLGVILASTYTGTETQRSFYQSITLRQNRLPKIR